MPNISSRAVKLVSDKEREIFFIINYSCFINLISIFGSVTNVINIIVFYKQGLDSTINISFFGLAISDLFSLVAILVFSIACSPLSDGAPMEPTEVFYLAAGLPHIYFARITGWITVYITAERCLCILLPLKIKQIITPKRTAIILCAIYVIVAGAFLPEYATSYIGWKFHTGRNKTVLGLVFTEHRGAAEGLLFILYSILGSVSFVAVIVFTIVLVIQLRQKSKWRKNATENKNMSKSISTRERKTMTMVFMIATILIVCYIPGVGISIVTFFEPEFSIYGKLVNIYFCLWSFAFIFSAINSSVNIFLYYKMSTKYRETFDLLFHIGNKN